MAQGNYGTSSNPLSELFAERIVLTPRTSDPSSPSQGDMWLRTDLSSGDKIATVRWQNSNGTQDIPVFGTSESTPSDIKKVLRIQTPNGLGFIPVYEGGGTYSELGLQHGGARHGVHDSLSAIPDSGIFRYEYEQDVTDSWNDNDGTDNTSAGYSTNSQFGTHSKAFDGTNDSIGIPKIYSQSEFSLSVWINTSTSSQMRVFVQRNTDTNDNHVLARVRGDDADQFQFFIRTSNDGAVQAETSTAVTDGNWHHVVGTYDGSAVKIYLDGSEEDSVAGTGDILEPTDGRIGSRYDQAGDFFDGLMDHTDGYNKALTATEVSDLYNTGSI